MLLTLKAAITTAADDSLEYFSMFFSESPLLSIRKIKVSSVTILLGSLRINYCCQGVGFHPFLPEKCHRKDDYIVNYPNLIGIDISPTGIWSTRILCVVNGVLQKGTNPNGTDQRHFTE